MAFRKNFKLDEDKFIIGAYLRLADIEISNRLNNEFSEKLKNKLFSIFVL